MSNPVPGMAAIFAMSWPMALRAIMLHGIVVIDTFLVAALGEEAVAVMGLASAIGGLLLGVLLAFSNATQIMVAQAFGSGRVVALKSALWCGLAINFAAALIGLAAMWVFSDRLLADFAHTPWIATEAGRYLAVFALVVLAEAAGQSLSAHFNGCGDTRAPFYSYVVSLPVNVGISYLLIHGLWGLPELGVTGAAAGSAIGSILRVAYLILRFRVMFAGHVDGPDWLHGRFAPTLRRHLGFALPIAVTFISAHLANSVCTFIYADLNVNEFAAMTLILPWVNVAGTLGMSWAQAVGIIVAQLLGRNSSSDRLDRFLATAWRGAFIAAAGVAIAYALVILCSGQLYADLEDVTRATLTTFLPTLLLLPFPKGSNAICGNTLRAGGETIYVMNIFVWSQWLFRVPATAIMVLWLDMSVTWVFSLLLFEEVVKLPAFHLRLFKGRWKAGRLA